MHILSNFNKDNFMQLHIQSGLLHVHISSTWRSIFILPYMESSWNQIRVHVIDDMQHNETPTAEILREKLKKMKEKMCLYHVCAKILTIACSQCSRSLPSIHSFGREPS